MNEINRSFGSRTRPIKQEPQEVIIDDTTCVMKQEPLDTTVKDINHRQILVDIGLGRKKVFVVRHGSALLDQFHQYIYSDPAFSELLRHSFPVLQEFNVKFQSWVDMDTEENLKDGTVVKTVFFPNSVEADESKAWAIKRKRDASDSGPTNKLQCIPPEYDKQRFVSLNISTEFKEANSSTSIVSSGQPKVLCTDEKTIAKETELTCKHCILKETPERKQHTINDTKSTSEDCIKQTTPQQKDNSSRKEPQEKPNATKKTPLKTPNAGKKTPLKSPNASKKKSLKTPNASEKTPLKTPNASEKTPQKKNNTIKNSSEIKNYAADEGSQKKVNATKRTSLKVSTSDVNKSQPGCAQQKKIDALDVPNKSGSDVHHTSKETNSLKCITWMFNTSLNSMKTFERQLWGKNMVNKNWQNTIFTDVCLFGLSRNQIKYCLVSKNSGVRFWGCLTSSGPKIIDPLGSSLKCSVLLQLLQDKVIPFVMKDQNIHGRIFLQAMSSETDQFRSAIVKDLLTENHMVCSVWPSYVKNISPMYHVCKLLEEKVKNTHCSSKKEMISIISQVWESDIDLKLMCNKYISSLPEIINSMVQQLGKNPIIELVWG